MAEIIYFPTKKQKVSFLPHVFGIILRKIRQRQRDIEQRKIDFLQNVAFQFFYDEIGEIEVRTSGIDLPLFILQEKAKEKRHNLACSKASWAVLNILKENRLNECYTIAKKKQAKLV